MSTNRYKLDVKLTNEQLMEIDDIRANAPRLSESGLGVNVEEYWNVYNQKLPMDEVEKIFSEAHNLKDFDPSYLPVNSFITTDKDLAAELLRVLCLDFVHDFKSGLFFFDLFARHEMLMASLFEEIYPKIAKGCEWEEQADKYIEHGLGCFKSSVSPTWWIGGDAQVPPYLSQFKNKFERMED